MSETKYTNLRFSTAWVVPTDDTNCLTPKEERAMIAKLNEAMERSFIEVLAGGYDVQVNRPGRKGTTIEHVRRKKPLTYQRRDP